MVRKSEKSKHPKRWHDIKVRLLGEQKNTIIDYARANNLSVNQLILYAVLDFINNQKGIPSPGSSQYAKTTYEDVISAYVRGERLFEPCGKTECDKKITVISGMEFCTTCNFRVG